ncbi:uncharacterized protein LOC102802634 [Saccoglossus kowalevskii]|uniref:Mucin-22-like n=1 Tax=Saccoglossus kowalevskii TaxID=10224 RepID=A0ABM0MKI2_SACKO|nr:PREDICTED: mucin-22-like [Saccoglossus kowalevskii]
MADDPTTTPTSVNVGDGNENRTLGGVIEGNGEACTTQKDLSVVGPISAADSRPGSSTDGHAVSKINGGGDSMNLKQIINKEDTEHTGLEEVTPVNIVEKETKQECANDEMSSNEHVKPNENVDKGDASEKVLGDSEAEIQSLNEDSNTETKIVTPENKMKQNVDEVMEVDEVLSVKAMDTEDVAMESDVESQKYSECENMDVTEGEMTNVNLGIVEGNEKVGDNAKNETSAGECLNDQQQLVAGNNLVVSEHQQLTENIHSPSDNRIKNEKILADNQIKDNQSEVEEAVSVDDLSEQKNVQTVFEHEHSKPEDSQTAFFDDQSETVDVQPLTGDDPSEPEDIRTASLDDKSATDDQIVSAKEPSEQEDIQSATLDDQSETEDVQPVSEDEPEDIQSETLDDKSKVEDVQPVSEDEHSNPEGILSEIVLLSDDENHSVSCPEVDDGSNQSNENELESHAQQITDAGGTMNVQSETKDSEECETIAVQSESQNSQKGNTTGVHSEAKDSQEGETPGIQSEAGDGQDGKTPSVQSEAADGQESETPDVQSEAGDGQEGETRGVQSEAGDGQEVETPGVQSEARDGQEGETPGMQSEAGDDQKGETPGVQSEAGDSQEGETPGVQSEAGDGQEGETPGVQSEAGDGQEGETPGMQSEARDGQEGETPAMQSEAGDDQKGETPGVQSEAGDDQKGETPGVQSEAGDSQESETPGVQSEAGDGQEGETPGVQSEARDGQEGETPGMQSEAGDDQKGETPGVQSEAGDSQESETPGVQSEAGDGQESETSCVQSEAGDGQEGQTPGVHSEAGDGQERATPGVQSEAGDGQERATPGVQSEAGDGQDGETPGVQSEAGDSQDQRSSKSEDDIVKDAGSTSDPPVQDNQDNDIESGTQQVSENVSSSDVVTKDDTQDFAQDEPILTDPKVDMEIPMEVDEVPDSPMEVETQDGKQSCNNHVEKVKTSKTGMDSKGAVLDDDLIVVGERDKTKPMEIIDLIEDESDEKNKEDGGQLNISHSRSRNISDIISKIVQQKQSTEVDKNKTVNKTSCPIKIKEEDESHVNHSKQTSTSAYTATSMVATTTTTTSTTEKQTESAEKNKVDEDDVEITQIIHTGRRPQPSCSQCKQTKTLTQTLDWNRQRYRFCCLSCMDLFARKNALRVDRSSHSTQPSTKTCGYCKGVIATVNADKFTRTLSDKELQFCSQGCLDEMRQRIKVCGHCSKDIVSNDSVLAQVGTKGEFKEFCNQDCVSQFEAKRKKSKEIMKCSVCEKPGQVKHEVNFQDEVHKLCSDACFAAFRYAHNLSMSCCDQCGVNCYNDKFTPQFMQFEGKPKRFCTVKCMDRFKQFHKKLVNCHWCKMKKNNFEMVERVDSHNELQLFCSLRCLQSFRDKVGNNQGVQQPSTRQATSQQPSKVIPSVSQATTMCDHCKKVSAPLFHLTMSDGSLRNFCCYNCVIAFQAHFATPTVTLPHQTLQLQCSLCHMNFSSKPVTLEYKGNCNQFCSRVCMEEFKRINGVTAVCDACHMEKILFETCKFSGQDRSFCSEGCKLLFKQAFTKGLGLKCIICDYCSQMGKALCDKTLDGKRKQFCSLSCRDKYELWYNQAARCDGCKQRGRKLEESFIWRGEMKHVCNQQCLLLFYTQQNVPNMTTQMQPKLSNANPVTAMTNSSTPVIASVMSLAPGQQSQVNFPSSANEAAGKRKRETDLPVLEQGENTDNPLRCPVKLYEFYLSKCPESVKNRNDVFYLIPERSCVPDSPVWYSCNSAKEGLMQKMLCRCLIVKDVHEQWETYSMDD